MFFFYASLGLLNSLWGLILAHTACAVPFVVMTVTVTLANFNVNLTRAAASLGAKPVNTYAINGNPDSSRRRSRSCSLTGTAR